MDLSVFQGRISEFSGVGPVCGLSFAFGLVSQAQQAKEPVAWLTETHSSFFPPDVNSCGIDLESLIVIRLPHIKAIARSADKLARSAAFGLIVLDLGEAAFFPRAILSRLNSLCLKHQIAIVCLTRKTDQQASLGPLVSLRMRTQRKWHSAFHYSVVSQVLKDKRASPGRHFEALYLSPPGLP